MNANAVSRCTYARIVRITVMNFVHYCVLVHPCCTSASLVIMQRPLQAALLLRMGDQFILACVESCLAVIETAHSFVCNITPRSS